MPAARSQAPPPHGGPASSPPRPPARRWWLWVAVGSMAVAAVVTVALLTAGGADGTAAPEDEASTSIATTSPTTPGTTEAPAEVEEIGQAGPASLANLTAAVSPDGTLEATWEPPGDERWFSFSWQSGDAAGSGELPAGSSSLSVGGIPCGEAVVLSLEAYDDSGIVAAASDAAVDGWACPLPPPSGLRFEGRSGTVDVRWDTDRTDLSYAVAIEHSSVQMPGVVDRDGFDLPAGSDPFFLRQITCGSTLEVAVAAISTDGTAYPPLTGTYRSHPCAVWEVLGAIQTVVEGPVDAEAGKIATVSAACPAGHSVVGGGFAFGNGSAFDAAEGENRAFVLGNRPSGDGWEVRVAVPPDAGFTSIYAVAVCIVPSGQSSPVSNGTQVANGASGSVVAACPAGTTLTGGGWWSDPFLDVSASEPAGNGWRVEAAGEAAGNSATLTSYALCYDDTRTASKVVTITYSVADGRQASHVNSEPCPEGSYLTGGGFTVSGGIAFWSTPDVSGADVPRDDVWQAGAVNPAGRGPEGATATVESYGVCLSVP